jgi:hypothetical protein
LPIGEVMIAYAFGAASADGIAATPPSAIVRAVVRGMPANE